MKKPICKLSLSRETLANLETSKISRIAAGSAGATDCISCLETGCPNVTCDSICC